MAAGGTTEWAVRAAQNYLLRSTPTLIVDGRWGSFTNAAYERASGEDRVAVDAILSGYGFTAEQLIQTNRAMKEAKDQSYQRQKDFARQARAQSPAATDMQKIEAAITKAADTTGVPRAWLSGFAKIESGFNPNAVNGSSRGLMQVQPAAWADVQKVDPSVGSYSNVLDPEKNALVGARYMALNQDRLRKMGYTEPITPAVLYLAHQQGAAGFVELWKSAIGLPTLTRFVTAQKMQSNPPQDGRGSTTNKGEFYRRWLAVAERKVGH